MRSRRGLVRALLLGSLGFPLSAAAQGRANEGSASPAAPRPRVRIGDRGTLVGLLLPRQDGPFERAATALLAGVRAAHARDGAGVVIEVIEVDDQADEIAVAVGDLHDRKAALMLGPITRNGVTALVELGGVPLPTLALNLPDALPPTSSRLMFLGLAIELEARQIAGLAYARAAPLASGRSPRAVLVNAASPLGRRGMQAFKEAWLAQGGVVREALEFPGSRPSRELRDRLAQTPAEVVFLAMGAEAARVVRGACAPETAVWGTSLASIGQLASVRMPELDGLKVLEMPWLIEPDAPAVMAYPRAPTGFNVEMQRLYALGIDAYRVARQLLAGYAAFELDGVTGRLNFDRLISTRVERSARVAEYRDGLPVVVGSP